MKINDKQVFGIKIGLALLFGFIMAFLASMIFFSQIPLLENVVVVKVFFTSFNIILLSILVRDYLKIYKEIPTPMSRGLAIFSVSLLFYAVTSSPIAHVIIGYEAVRLGFFTFIPDMFVSLAATILMYQNHR